MLDQVCPFDTVKQDYTLLGTYQSFSPLPENATQMAARMPLQALVDASTGTLPGRGILGHRTMTCVDGATCHNGVKRCVLLGEGAVRAVVLTGCPGLMLCLLSPLGFSSTVQCGVDVKCVILRPSWLLAVFGLVARSYLTGCVPGLDCVDWSQASVSVLLLRQRHHVDTGTLALRGFVRCLPSSTLA